MPMNPDRLIHEPARLRIMMILSGVDEADFKFMLSATGTTKGNLSSHADRLEQAGYIEITKSFNGKIPNTRYRLTPAGKSALEKYWAVIDEMRALSGKGP
ncbi:MAG: transcriptional regulator [Candidatus Hydrogenedentes bacterium]|nr:transcriptional regulator [Candidatus Hydrogenedentota bacterium]